jgi:competence protein CoiA
MYAALLNGQLILARTAAGKEGQFRCPRCQKQVILVTCQQKSPFFKHLCLNTGQGEEQEHYMSKCLLKSALTAAGLPAKLEVPLADGRIRADVLASPRLAFEVQCAPLSQEEFAYRNGCYREIGVTDIWVVGHRHFLRRQLNKSQLIYLRENKAWGCYYLEVRPDNHQLSLKYNIWQRPWQNRLFYQQRLFSLDEYGLEKLWHFKPSLVRPQLNPQRQQTFLAEQIRRKTKLGRTAAQLLYENKIQLEEVDVQAFSYWRKPGSQPPWQLLIAGARSSAT